MAWAPISKALKSRRSKGSAVSVKMRCVHRTVEAAGRTRGPRTPRCRKSASGSTGGRGRRFRCWCRRRRRWEIRHLARWDRRPFRECGGHWRPPTSTMAPICRQWASSALFSSSSIARTGLATRTIAAPASSRQRASRQAVTCPPISRGRESRGREWEKKSDSRAQKPA